jgi:hypothetical protein
MIKNDLILKFICNNPFWFSWIIILMMLFYLLSFEFFIILFFYLLGSFLSFFRILGMYHQEHDKLFLLNLILLTTFSWVGFFLGLIFYIIEDETGRNTNPFFKYKL